jgi:sterol desaturase/sphingolipid hydroxylase (fatty acid hydroxylase superfamily)
VHREEERDRAAQRHSRVRAFSWLVTPLLTAAVLGLALAERRRPLRPRAASRVRRWPVNAAFALASSPVQRLAVLPVLASSPRGLLARLPGPPWARGALGLVALDASMWLWHRANHRVPALWRFHRAHHQDPDLDVTTALRFHPVELALSVLFRVAQQRALGPGPLVALAHEAATLGAALFHHADVDLGAGVDRALARVVITPRLHGAHHLRDWRMLSSNLGVVLSIWDRLAGTHVDGAAAPALPIGVPGLRE